MPITQSLLDTDFYKFTMGHWVFRRYPDVQVRYAFKNRTARVPLAEYIHEAELRRELDHVRTLRVQPAEAHYLRSIAAYGDALFSEEYLQFLQTLCLPPYELECRDGTYRLEFVGPWCTTIYWETLALSIINELYFRARLHSMSTLARDVVTATGTLRLADKIQQLRARPDITFSDFGTRRRFGRRWHEYVIRVLAEELPRQLLGTSNTALAMQYGILPIGTLAHEMFMVMAARSSSNDTALRASHNRVLQEWWEQYGWGLSIALTDTYGSAFFLQDMTAAQAQAWKGLRQDSGDPMAFGEQAIAFYRQHGVDPRDKLLIFSDGLDLGTILKLADHFAGRIQVGFGWGTNLTNDLGLDALSLVIKAVAADGHPTVKLSDNLAKATGQGADIARFKRVFGHTVTTFEDCRY
ncbi:MAG: nicotinate phosphoribosyltransferase [Candidatus Tectomicrobia bacterium]|uniref:Nicotinate phosphoribosyltransferase n=1 Tax=Tectimicrobiota bacterium TaxID=2528274 RepID=A0A937VWR3_UNCTE|nr:nicotinate phosphoribosyltransferase [Candidatus Tectomicrobia bacterium]